MDGMILIDKPADWTSHDVVNKVRGIIRREVKEEVKERPNTDKSRRKVRVGHAGTLDPMATGLLILLVGSYTKRSQEFMKQDKVYEAEITLGFTSSTDDAEGELERINEKTPTANDVKAAIESFIGTHQQTPPSVSAVKVEGERAYKRIRQGQTVDLNPRQVTVHSIDRLTYGYPLVGCRLHVSSGTYIRSIARDLGEKLETGAYLSALRRTSIGQFSVSDAFTVEALNKNPVREHLVQA